MARTEEVDMHDNSQRRIVHPPSPSPYYDYDRYKMIKHLFRLMVCSAETKENNHLVMVETKENNQLVMVEQTCIHTILYMEPITDYIACGLQYIDNKSINVRMLIVMFSDEMRIICSEWNTYDISESIQKHKFILGLFQYQHMKTTIEQELVPRPKPMLLRMEYEEINTPLLFWRNLHAVNAYPMNTVYYHNRIHDDDEKSY